jgi:hypothetical protein
VSLSHSPSIITQNLVLCLDAANPKSYPGSGTTWFDISGNNNNTTRFVGVTYEQDINGGALRFDGSSNPMEQTNFYNSSASSPLFLGTSPSTVNNWNGDSTYEAWVKPLVLGGSNTGHIFSDNNYNEGEVEIDSSRIRCLWSSGNSILYSITPDTTKWYHIVMWHSREATVYRLKLYVDNLLVGNTTRSISGSADTYGPDNRLTIGHLFNGYIANIKIYSRSLSDEEIQQNYNALRSRFSV